MAKYIFTQPYTIRTGNVSITSGGATGGTIVKSFNTGDIIEGVRKSTPAGIPNAPANVFVETVVNGQTFQISDFLLKEYTGTANANNTNNKGASTTIFTTKNIIIGVVAIVAVIGALKVFKVI